METLLIYPLLSKKRAVVDENKQFWPPLGLEGYIYTIAVHGPVLIPDKATLERDAADISAHGGSGTSAGTALAHYEKIYGNARSYDISKRDGLRIDDIDAVGPDYIILSGSKDTETGEELSYYLEKDFYEKRAAIRKAVSDRYDLMRSIPPTDIHTLMLPHLMDQDYRIIRNVPYGRLAGYVRGPAIDIFRIRSKGD